MARLSADHTYVTVERGDTLSEIARAYSSYSNNATYQQLAAINSISNPNLIYVGQKIYLTNNGSSGSGSSSSSSSNTNQATIDQFGYQSNSSDTLFAVWSWSKDHTENYEVEWCYDTGDGPWFIGNTSTSEHKQSTYSIPSNAKRVKFRVKPISETYTSNNNTTSYWTANWSTAKIYNVEANPPSVPSTPEVEIKKYKLTATLDNLDVNATQIQFKIVKDNSKTFKTGMATITTGHASYSCNVDAGGEYKVACRSYNGSIYSDWSEYSDNQSTIPSAPTGITTCKAASETSVYLEWPAVTSAESYSIEYTTKKQYFDGSDQVTTLSDIKTTKYEKTGLQTGQEYFFRVCAVNDQGESSWSDIVSVVLGTNPSAPTTWSSTTTVMVGEELTLYWMHNVEDGSDQTYAELELIIDGEMIPHTITGDTDRYVIDTSKYTEGTTIKWRVHTAGISKVYGEWSVQRVVNVYAPVTLALNMLDPEGNEIDLIESFPVYISALAGPNTQLPIGYHLSVISNEMYETTDRAGNRAVVTAGQEVYSKHFDITDALMVELSAGNIDLENNVGYTIMCTVSMDSGLTAEASLPITVAWTDVMYTPNAEINLDTDAYVTHIRPFCRSYEMVRYKVDFRDGVFIKTAETIDRAYGEPMIGRITMTGETVYYGTTADGDEAYFCQVEESEVVSGVTLSVYRREFDGKFTELATGLINGNDTCITDPHPALDYARYRIVAISDDTGAVGYYDLPGYPVGGTAAIIQWDEAWTNFDVNNTDALEEPAWAGSMLKLPYNIDVSDSTEPDLELVEYIGREHPVVYHGTQRGYSSNWDVEIAKDDKETLYAIRRLQNWMGPAYVREPSGSGYWASVKVSYDQTHCEVTIPVKFSITRVEGGV